VARARNASLVVANGADPRGWLPVLRESETAGPARHAGILGNGTAQLSGAVTVDRSMATSICGNPHVSSIRITLHRREGSSPSVWRRWTRECPHFAARRGFQARWQQAMVRWETAAAVKGMPVVVIHKDQTYLCRWLGLQPVAAIEPKPGVPPSAGYLASLVSTLSESPPRMILRNAYNDPKAANWLAERVHAPVVTLPFSVGGTPDAKDLFGLFDDTVTRLLGAMK
jgi:zinc/manganese transport system substrate-binding protein